MRGLIIGCVALIAACSADPTPGADAGPPPPAALDAAPPSDAGVAISIDAARPDGAHPDAAPPDAGPPDAGAAPLSIADPGPQRVDERARLQLRLTSSGDDQLRVFALDLPPGATWSENDRTLDFVPDFTQGGRSYEVMFEARDRSGRVTRTVTIEVNDTVRPPPPVIVNTEVESGYTRYTVEQTTDGFLDSPGYAGRVFTNTVMVPDGISPESPRPVRLRLHGFGARSTSRFGWSREVRVAPHDPDNTYWYGYSSSLPAGDASQGELTDYTQRRALHLLDWTLRRFPGADRERVYAQGSSMGGAGATTIGLTRARHFAWISATIGQTIPRNHRPSRQSQLSRWYGAAGARWDVIDLTRVLMELPEARDQLMFIKHGKDDPVIHFGAVVHRSPLTNASFYEALQAERVGHLAVWDEGGHGTADPVLGSGWWNRDFNPMFDDTTFVRRNLAFIAFSGALHDGDPGNGGGNGRVPWSSSSGYSADDEVAGDTGWNGAIAGAYNRLLRWDAGAIEDTVDRFSVPLRVVDGEGAEPPQPGYPHTGDRLGVVPPVVVDVTPRRTQAFRCRPGEAVVWTFATMTGTVTAGQDGSVSVLGLPVSTAWQTLELRRAR